MVVLIYKEKGGEKKEDGEKWLADLEREKANFKPCVYDLKWVSNWPYRSADGCIVHGCQGKEVGAAL